MVKATNVLSGEVGYAVLLMCSVNQVSSLTKLVERAELSAEVAFWVNAAGTKSKGKSLEAQSKFTPIQLLILNELCFLCL